MFGVEPICTVLTAHGCRIALSTYDDARSRLLSKRAPRDAEIVALIALRGKKPRTTIASEHDPRPGDLVDRDFTAARPNQLWVADFTHVATWSGTVYVAFVFEVLSRRIVGWRAATTMTTAS